MPTTRFFATRRDLEPGLRAMETRETLWYMHEGWENRRGRPGYASALDIPGLGIEKARQVVGGRRFIVMPRGTAVSEEVIGTEEGVWYEVLHWRTPGSVQFQPGGMYAPGILMAGHVFVSPERKESVRLYRQFTRHMTKGFTRVRSWLVGPEALELLNSGGRLVPGSLDAPDRGEELRPLSPGAQRTP